MPNFISISTTLPAQNAPDFFWCDRHIDMLHLERVRNGAQNGGHRPDGGLGQMLMENCVYDPRRAFASLRFAATP
jgi:hypothetical protein